MSDAFDDANAITIGSMGAGVANRVLRVGDVVGGSYRLKSLLGRGGMGYVFCAEHTMIRREYALKMLAPEQLNEVSRARFEVEGKAIANLEHPNIVKVYNMGLDRGDCPFYVMDLLGGESMSDYIEAGRNFGIRRWVDIFIQIASGLGYAHSKGIVHRDVKPSNIVLLESGQGITVKLVDFGIAKLLPSADLHAQSQTATGEVFGSPYYMSPEQSIGTTVDLRSDIYSLGCTWYEALCGVQPYRGENALKTIMMHQEAPIPSIVQSRPDRGWPDAVDDLLAKMMAKRPDNRYQSMEQLIHDLERLKAGKIIGKVETGGATLSVPALMPVDNDGPQLNIKAVVIALSLLAVAVGGAVTTISLMKSNTPAAKVLNTPLKDSISNTALQSDGTLDNLRAAVSKTRTDKELIDVLDSNKLTTVSEDKEQLPKAIKAYEAAGPIKSKIVGSGPAAVKRFVFPKWPMGHVTDGGTKEWMAVDQIDVSATAPLAMQIGYDESRHVFSYPGVLKKIAPQEFNCLWLRGRKRAGLASSVVGVDIAETDGVMAILDIVSHWTKLRYLVLSEINVPAEMMKRIDACGSVDALGLKSLNINISDLAKAKILSRVNALEFDNVENIGPGMPAVAAAPHLVLLHLYNCDLNAADIAVLNRSKTLRTLEIKQDVRQVLPAIASLKNITALAVLGVGLRSDEIHMLTSKPNIRNLVLSRSNYSAVDKIRYGQKEKKVIFQ